MSRKKIIGWCSIEGCERPLKTTGLCQYHYNKKRLEENPSKAKSGLRGHPYYHLWFERKQNGLLCERWLNFEYFIWDIQYVNGGKPEGEFFLNRKDGTKLFGPDNFKWVEHLRRKPNETASEWNARKRASRIEANPSLESDRNLKRQYGLTREEYDEKLKSQNYVCFICEQLEKTLDGKTGVAKRLAVDHCHNSNKLRKLLCWRCNSVLGKVEDNSELLIKMAQYLKMHNGD